MSEKVQESIFQKSSRTTFKEICICSDGDLKVSFCGIEFYEDFLRLKFYCFLMMDDVTDIYVQNLKVNGKTHLKLRTIARISNCEYEHVNIDIYDVKDIAFENFSDIELELVEISEGYYDLRWLQKLQITCDTRQKTYTLNINECKFPEIE